MYDLLAALPAPIDLILITVVPSALLVVLHWLFRRVVPPERLLPHHEVAGFLIAVVGVMYAVTLGFVVVTAAVAFDAAQSNADIEAGDAGELIETAKLLPNPDASRLRRDLANYAVEVRDREWPMLSEDRQDLRARDYIVDAMTAVSSSSAEHHTMEETMRETAIRSDAFNMLRDMSERRRHRLIDAGHRLPAILYGALMIGALAVFAFVFLFGVDNQVVQLTMTGLVAASICVLLGVVVLLDHPYSGSYRVSAEAWTLVIDNNNLDRYASVPQSGR